MRSFEVTLTYKAMMLNRIFTKNIVINKQKVLEVDLDDSHCSSPEEFCDAIITIKERTEVVRLNIVEKFTAKVKPLNWVAENFGRIYFHNGIPLILNKN